MSGIAGIYYLDGRPVEQLEVQRMLDSIAHRGPDGASIWTDESAGLGHLMLWTTPESLHEKLPLKNKTGDLTITADARIDNRGELIPTLNLNGRPRETISDSEIILAAYEKWGEKCPEKLLGDFSFAIWDKKRERLYCARDPIGVRPFCYYHRPGSVFMFASEIRAMLCLHDVPKEINEGRIADYLVTELEGIDHTSTFYRWIFRLPPAHTMCVDRQGLSTRCYWSPSPDKEVRCASDLEYAQDFLEVFTESVCSRLRSAHRVGSTLSGGLDSSSIVGVARNLLQKNGAGPLMTFSAVSTDETGCEESQAIRAVIDQGGLQPYTVSPDQLRPFLPDFEYVLQHMDDLFDSTLLHLVPAIFSLARRQDVRSLLTGLDGDLVVSHGFGYLAQLLRSGHWRPAILEARGMTRFYERFNLSPWKLLYENSRTAFAPTWLRKVRRKLRNGNRLPETGESTIIDPGFARRINLADRLETLRAHGGIESAKNLRESQARALQHPYLAVALERYDRVASAYSIELRHPFLDRRLIEFCLAMPWKQKRSKGWSKVVLRRAMAGILPETVCWRNFGQHIGWFFAQAWFDLIRDFMQEILQNQSHIVRSYVNIPALVELNNRCTFKGRSNKELEEEENIWHGFNLTLWLARQLNLENQRQHRN
jgi:asparagine synthase (glutamine-hydrolysing)